MPLTLVPDSSSTSGPVPLQGGQVRLGSNSNADLRLPALAPEHALIVRDGSEWRLTTEMEATVGGIPVRKGARRLLLDGDVIELGSVKVRCVESDTVAPENVDTARLALAMLRHADKVGAHATSFTLVRVEGGETTTHALAEGETLTVGRDADWSLDDARVSRKHVELRTRAGALEIRDLGSVGGSLLGGHPLDPNRWAAWPRELHLRLGSTVLAWLPPREHVLAVKVEHLEALIPRAAEDELEAPAATPDAAPVPAETKPPVVDASSPVAEAPVPAKVAAPRRGGALHPAILPIGIALIVVAAALLMWWVLRG
ncbi:hypothetical protein BH09MYX1_BH09MYX1_31240 [soil metagenome]